MKVMLAQSAGFCFGVRRAVQLAEKIAAGDAPYVMLGPVIHNDHVIEHLTEQGVGCVERVDQVPPGCGVIIRSHGEGKAVYDKLQEMGCPVADATCVKGAKIHQIVPDASRRGDRSSSSATPSIRRSRPLPAGVLVLKSSEMQRNWGSF